MSSLVKLKKFFWFFLKLAIAGGIVGYLVARNPAEIADGFKAFDYKWARSGRSDLLRPYAGLFLALVPADPDARRRAVAVRGAFADHAGVFLLPGDSGGAIGGDVVKMGVLSKRSAAGSRWRGPSRS